VVINNEAAGDAGTMKNWVGLGKPELWVLHPVVGYFISYVADVVLGQAGRMPRPTPHV
jgi:hypothetical protein